MAVLEGTWRAAKHGSTEPAAGSRKGILPLVCEVAYPPVVF